MYIHLPCHELPCRGVPRHVVLCHVVACNVSLCQFISLHIHFVSFHIMSHHVVSCRIVKLSTILWLCAALHATGYTPLCTRYKLLACYVHVTSYYYGVSLCAIILCHAMSSYVPVNGAEPQCRCRTTSHHDTSYYGVNRRQETVTCFGFNRITAVGKVGVHVLSWLCCD